MGNSREGEPMTETVEKRPLPENVPLGRSSEGWEDKVRAAGVDDPRRGHVGEGADGFWYWIPWSNEVDDPVRREQLKLEEDAWDVDE